MGDREVKSKNRICLCGNKNDVDTELTRKKDLAIQDFCFLGLRQRDFWCDADDDVVVVVVDDHDEMFILMTETKLVTLELPSSTGNIPVSEYSKWWNTFTMSYQLKKSYELSTDYA